MFDSDNPCCNSKAGGGYNRQYSRFFSRRHRYYSILQFLSESIPIQSNSNLPSITGSRRMLHFRHLTWFVHILHRGKNQLDRIEIALMRIDSVWECGLDLINLSVTSAPSVTKLQFKDWLAHVQFFDAMVSVFSAIAWEWCQPHLDTCLSSVHYWLEALPYITHRCPFKKSGHTKPTKEIQGIELSEE